MTCLSYSWMIYFCYMRYISYSLLIFIFVNNAVCAQEKWDLRKCVDYALANNISIKQTEVQTKLAELQLKQSRLGKYPSLNFSGGPGYNSGRNQDPTTYSLITQGFVSANMQLQSSAEIFNWFSKKNAIMANEWQVEANKASTDKLKNDIALVVANSYLQVLLSKEQERIAAVQVQQTQAQLTNTRKLVDAGSLPELNAAELEAQLARDSSGYVTAKGSVEQAILSLKAYMNLDASTEFDVAVPPVELIPIESIADLQPEAVFALAVINLPQQRVNDFNLKAAKKNSESARGAMFPTISAYGSLSSNFINSKLPVYQFSGNYTSNVLSPQVEIAGTPYKVSSPEFVVAGKKGTPFFTQLDNNFRQSVGLSINVPIFNGGNARTAWERSKLNIQNVELQKSLDNQKIKQDIYQAYSAAVVAMEKFNAGKKSVEAAQRSYDFAQKRYAVGMLPTLDLITNQNNLFTAKLQNALNQFDYVFKMKVLEFYKGQGLKL